MQYRLRSAQWLDAPGLVRQARTAHQGASPLTESEQGKAAALYMLANAFPAAPAFILLMIAAGRYHIDGTDVVVGDEVIDLKAGVR